MKSSRFKIQLLAIFAAAVIAFVGCGKPSNLAPLQGTVTYQGKPLEFGSLMLQPVKGGQASRADIQSDGSFAMKTIDGQDGATIGLNRVRVTCFPSQKPGATNQAGGEVSLGKSLIPEDYNNFSSSQLTIEVLPENNPPYAIELKN